STTPGACVKASSAPISPCAPQCAHFAGLAVISKAKTSRSRPATALPSSISARLMLVCSFCIGLCSFSIAGRSEPFRSYPHWWHAKLSQAIRGCFDQQRRAADIRQQRLPERLDHFAQHRRIDPPRVALPPRRLRARECVNHLQTVVRGLQAL